jgi:sulfhydrogenase subunit beta (sulfur reductase)
MSTIHYSTSAILERGDFQLLLDALQQQYRIIGPTVRDQAIVYEEIAAVTDLPIGWTDEQDGGTYRLRRRNDEALFGYVVGPHSWKKFLHLPHLRLWQAQRTEDGFDVVPEAKNLRPMAFIGVRSCELHAIAIQDKVLLNDQFTDTFYEAQRADIFIVAVNCGQAGGTCFCVSMQTGPRATFGYDLVLTEVLENNQHYFVVEAGTEQGQQLLNQLPHRAALPEEQQKVATIATNTSAQMGRAMDTTDIKELLYRNLEHPRWDDVATRCLTCANCTMVCPTCFCTTVEDVTDLSGEHAERWRRWDSCFTLDFTYLHGGSVRVSTKSRYRQWMTHKLASWIDQFGSSGCVGCGRCITWCPVGIDLTEEVRAIRTTEKEAEQ